MAARQPAPGDVVITREAGAFSISIVPDRHQLTLPRLDEAIRIATMWAKERNVKAWHLTDGPGIELLD